MKSLLLRLLPLAAAAGLPLSAVAQDAAAALPIFAATETAALKGKDGQKIVVYGETARSGKSQNGMNFVNFAGAEFYLIAFKSDLGAFKDGEPADVYDGKRLVVTGVVTIYKDKPQIKLTSPDQVRVLAADEAWPQAAAPAQTAAPAPAVPANPAPAAAKSAEEPKKKPPVDPKLYFK